MTQNVGRFEALFSAPAEQSSTMDKLGRDIQPPIHEDMGPPVDPQKDTYQELERKYRHRTYQAQELMVEKLLRGHFIDTKTLERKLHMFDLDFRHELFMVVLVRPAGTETMFSGYTSDIRDDGQVGLIVSSIFSELLGERYACFPANLEDRYAFLLNYSDPDEDAVAAVVAATCREAVKFIHNNFDMDLRVCISGTCNGLHPLHDTFRETERVVSDGATNFVDGVCAKAEGGGMGPRKPEPTIEKQYLNALVTQDFQMALQLTMDKAREIYAENGDMERVRMFLQMRMQTTGSVLAVPMGAIASEGGTPGGGGFIFFDQVTSLETLETVLTSIFTKLDRHFNTTPSDYTGTTGKVVHLISKRYMEPDLSVEMICDCLGKSRSYLSRMFKENTGMNLLDYLHTTRLTEAKKLLNETDLGISEIAAKVGYYSGWTLARVFKRYEGITPTAYRKAFCGVQDT